MQSTGKATVLIGYLCFIIPYSSYSGFGTEFYCVGEYLPDKPEYVFSNGGPMDGVWHQTHFCKIRESLTKEPTSLEELKDVIDARRQDFKKITDVVNYQSNHDHDRLIPHLGL